VGDHEIEETGGISRRSMLKRSALVGGTLVWAAPAVQTLATPAYAQGSPACDLSLQQTVNGICLEFVSGTSHDPECCRCLESGTLVIFCTACAGDVTVHIPPRPCP